MTSRARSYLLNGLDLIEKKSPRHSQIIEEFKRLLSGVNQTTGRAPIKDFVPITAPDISLNPIGPLFVNAIEKPREEGWQHDLMSLYKYMETEANPTLTASFKESIESILSEGLDLHGKTIVMTGCGPGSIGLEMVNRETLILFILLD